MASEDYKSLKVNKKSLDKPLGANNVIQVSEAVVHGLKNVAAKKVVNFEECENEWINKLATIDDEHSKKYGLNTRNADSLITSLSSMYLPTQSERYCSFETDRVTACLGDNKEDSLSCTNEVAEFKTCIDKSLHDTVRKDEKEKRNKKKESFTEAFERTY